MPLQHMFNVYPAAHVSCVSCRTWSCMPQKPQPCVVKQQQVLLLHIDNRYCFYCVTSAFYSIYQLNCCKATDYTIQVQFVLLEITLPVEVTSKYFTTVMRAHGSCVSCILLQHMYNVACIVRHVCNKSTHLYLTFTARCRAFHSDLGCCSCRTS